MRLRNGARRFGLVAKSFHWGTAALVIPLWGLGWYMVGQTQDLFWQYELYQLHKSFGFVVFGLALLRLVWRLVDPAPPLPAGMGRPLRLAAHLSHLGLYACLIGLPVTGFLMSAASPLGIPTVLFDTIPVPHPLGPSEVLYELFRAVHYWMAMLLAALLAAHVLAALHHHLVAKDDVLLRMIPFGRPKARFPDCRNG
ncbi:MAG TPA: cytochrome b [Geminicoccus sp.]|uniref:cytochrome b n=1 Tax=Geminicoccus sp. TaxID=2024832 RepID=UPI002BE52FCE|nr:cytochrome b [Geminicoccus sp.]HWL72181.1 cytochrome b [Geminicoccus sp.]